MSSSLPPAVCCHWLHPNLQLCSSAAALRPRSFRACSLCPLQRGRPLGRLSSALLRGVSLARPLALLAAHLGRFGHRFLKGLLQPRRPGADVRRRVVVRAAVGPDKLSVLAEGVQTPVGIQLGPERLQIHRLLDQAKVARRDLLSHRIHEGLREVTAPQGSIHLPNL
eukprot:scaffold501_cov355-Pinguiococcus_pyrenoidosus.AAC.15